MARRVHRRRYDFGGDAVFVLRIKMPADMIAAIAQGVGGIVKSAHDQWLKNQPATQRPHEPRRPCGCPEKQ